MKNEKREMQNGAEERREGGVTIVGGRPMHRAVNVADLPVGVEQALTLAALNHRFREALGRDPAAAAARHGIRLTAVEVGLLRDAGPERLADMAKRMLPPKDPGRRRFLRNVAASIVALIAGKAYLLCSGCTGADTFVPQDGQSRQPLDTAPPRPDPIQEFATLAGHVCYIYVPGTVQIAEQGKPLLVALHDETEACVANVQRWSGVADQYGVSLVSVNWTEEPMDAAGLAKLAGDLGAIAEEFAEMYPVDPFRRYLASRGKSTPIVFDAGFVRNSQFWAAAAFLGGVPLENCMYGLNEPRPFALVEGPPALYWVLGQKDDDFMAANKCLEMLNFYDCTDLKVEWLDGRTADASLFFGTIWEWMAQHQAGGRNL